MPNAASDPPVVPRPGLVRQDTDAFLSYYLSSPDDDKKAGLQRQSSVVSESSSDYSTSSSLSEYSIRESSSSSNAQQRQGLSKGASDRRRLALVELDDTASQVSNPSDSLRSRRGLDNRIALVAPPDTSAKLISSLTPPPSAPVSGSMVSHEPIIGSHNHGDERGHHRSASDAAKKSTSPRNVAIVGSRPLAPLFIEPISQDGVHPPMTTSDITSLRPPIFMHPQSRSPSPAATLSADGEVFTFKNQSLATTPDIGEGKPIDKPVAAPVVVPLTNTTQSSLDATAGYLDYQPGLHATAGPLPAPPEDSSVIKRPKKDMELVKQALQLPASVTAALATKNKTSSEKDVKVINGLDSWTNRPSHRREGAFAPSDTSHTGTSETQEQTAKMHESNDIQSIVVQSPTSPDTSVPMSRDPTWITDMSPEGRTSADSRTSAEMSTSSHTPSSTMSHSTAPSPPPKSPKSFRTSLTKGLKRMSLPRSPSFKSLARSSSVGHSAGSHPRTPSPSLPPPPPRQPRPKIRSLYPAALYCHEVYSLRNAQERCTTYAQKINELYSCDCGLGDWLFEAQIRRPNGSRSTLKLNANLSVPSAQHFSPQPRHTSRSSVISDATFPNRPDATTATDLSTKPEQLIGPHVPPPLPYPALAVNLSRSQGNGSSTPPSSSRPSKAGNFFASLGRKASISRKDRQPGTPSSQPARLTKNPPAVLRSSATVPGGPRAPGGRASRSQTLMPPATPISSNSDTEKFATLRRTPSLTNIPSDGILNIAADPQFSQQVDRLADLLPHADRDILAGYLQRAGQDMLAIGQYLEDEKHGALIQPV